MNVPQRVLTAALDGSSQSIAITDAEIDLPGPRVVYVNSAFEKLTGYAARDILGGTPRRLQGPLTDRTVLDRLRMSLVRGEPFEGETVNYRNDGTAFVMHWTVAPVSEGGEIRYWIAHQNDVTDLRLRERFDRAESAVADIVARVDFAPVPASPLQLLKELHKIIQDAAYVGTLTLAAKVRDHLASVPDLPPAEIQHLLRTARRSVRMGLTSTHQVVSGAGFDDVAVGLLFDDVDRAHRTLFDRVQLDRTARTVEAGVRSMARTLERRREALVVQRILRPATDYDIEGFEVAARYVSSARSEVAGGDWHDVARNGAGVRFAVGDVSGKGVRAAAEMGLLRSHLHAQLVESRPIDVVLSDLGAFCRSEGIVATVAMGEFRRDGSVALALAGHPPPIVTGPSGSRFVAASPAPPLGAFPGDVVSPDVVHEFVLGPGDVVFAYTDGAIDERNLGLSEGLDGLLAILADAARSTDGMCDAVLELISEDPTDDVALLAIRPS